MLREWNPGAREAKISLKGNWQRVDPEPSSGCEGAPPSLTGIAVTFCQAL